MIRSILGASIRFRWLLVGVAAALLAVGITQLRSAPTDVLPEFTPPYVEIQTEAPGLSAEEVEQFITVPLEADLLNGVQNVDVLRSESLPGLSSIVLVFEPGSDLYAGRALVQERLTQLGAAAFPSVSKPPTMLQPLSSSSRVLMIGLSSDDLSRIDQSVIARWTMRPRLMGVPGVANVAIWGMRDQQLQVQVDPEQLRERDLTLDQVIATTGNAQVASPVSFLEASTPGTGGFIETPQQRLQVRNVVDKIASPKKLGKVPVEGTGGNLTLADVAEIKIDHQPLIGDAVVNGGQGLFLVVEKFPGANAVEVTQGVEEALHELEPGLAGIQTDTSVFRPATFIEDAIDNLTLTLVIAAVLVMLLLGAFLFHWRTVIVCLITIPLSLIAAALVLDMLGETFNAISFAGLAAGLAIVIDDAVLGAENVARRLRQNREAGSDRSTANVVREASHEMRSPLAYATLIGLLAIVPVVVMEGRPGAFFEPLAYSYALAVGAAMLVALTITPALSMLLFSRGSAGRLDSPVLRRLAPRHAAALSRALSNPRTVLIAAAGAAVAALAVLPFLGTSLIPSFKDRDVLVRLDSAPGTSNPRMTQITTRVSEELRQIPGVENVGAHVGRAVTGDQLVDVNSSEVWVSVASDADYDATMASIEDTVQETRGVNQDVVTYSTQRIRDVGALEEGVNPVRSDDLDVLTGSRQPLVVRLYGQDLDVLRGEAKRLQDVIAGVDGVVDPRVAAPVTQPTVAIEVDLNRAQEAAIKPGDVRRAEAVLLQGIQVGSVFQEQKVFDVMVQGVPSTRRSVATVRNLLIDKPDGGHVRLGDVADVNVTQTPIVIQREAVSRYLDVEADVSGRSLDAVAADVESRLADVRFPLEYHAEVLKKTTGEEIGSMQMLAFAVGAAIASFLLLQAAFRSWRLAVLVFLALPVALVGAVAAVLIDGAELSLGALLGFLAVLGIAVRHGIVLVRHLQELEEEDDRKLRFLSIERGTREWFGPIATSVGAIAAAALPFAIAGEIPGLEIVHPMAIALLGGLVSAALLSLLVLPALYLRFGPPARPRVSREEEIMHRLAGIEPVLAAPAEPGAVPAGHREGAHEHPPAT